MKKLINRRTTLLEESLDGFAAAHADIIVLGEARKYVCAAGRLRPGKVALISGGGSGHEPLHARLCRPRHARRRLSGADFHLADAGPDGGRRRGCRPGAKASCSSSRTTRATS